MTIGSADIGSVWIALCKLPNTAYEKRL